MIKTSTTHPIEVGFVEAAVVGGPGAIGFTIAPGKRAAAADGHTWQRDLDSDLARIRQAHAMSVVVSLLERPEQHKLGIRDFRRTARRHGLDLIKFPIPDGGVPGLAPLRLFATRLSEMLDRGSRVLVHCRGGLGRSGLVVAAVLVVRGVSPDRAVRAVRSARPGAIETEEQARLVHALAAVRVPDKATALAAQQWLRGLQLGPAFRISALDVFPVLVPRLAGAAPCLLAPEAIERGVLAVAELPDGAVVENLLAVNRGDVAVLVLEGETLVGCKQNRVVTRTVLVPAKGKVILRVACMEQGRWTRVSNHFRSGGTRMEARMRSHNLSERARGGFDQSRLWNQVEERLTSAGVHSGTSDFDAFASSRAASLEVRAQELTAQPGQLGVLILHGDRLVSIEVLATPELWKRVAGRTIPSLLLASEGLSTRPLAAAPEEWLARLAQQGISVSAGAGLGSDIAIAGDGFAGSGLWLGESMLHLAVFGSN